MSAPDAAPPAHAAPPPLEGETTRPHWPAWAAFVALFAGLAFATVGGIIVDVPALALGANITSSHTPPGIVIADTFVQDVGFIAAAVLCAQIGTRAVHSWDFGLRPPVVGFWRAVRMVFALIGSFVLLSIVWNAIFNPGEEKLLETLGSKQSAALLVLSAALTCIVAPISEEMLFRGFIFTALRSWRGTLPAAIVTGLLFGGVHAFSAPALDLPPLAALGFGLCLLYRASGSLYPCFAAHALNNSVAFASLEGWSFGAGVLLLACALAGVAALVRAAQRLGVIRRAPAPVTWTP